MVATDGLINGGNGAIIRSNHTVEVVGAIIRVIDGRSVAATKCAMAVMERTVEERTQSEQTVDMTQSERSYRAIDGRSVAATMPAMAVMERTQSERIVDMT